MKSCQIREPPQRDIWAVRGTPPIFPPGSRAWLLTRCLSSPEAWSCQVFLDSPFHYVAVESARAAQSSSVEFCFLHSSRVHTCDTEIHVSIARPSVDGSRYGFALFLALSLPLSLPLSLSFLSLSPVCTSCRSDLENAPRFPRFIPNPRPSHSRDPGATRPRVLSTSSSRGPQATAQGGSERIQQLVKNRKL